MKYLKYFGFLILGILTTTIYFTDNKAKYINMYAIKLYMKTNIGRESLRNQFHAECYFGVQRVILGSSLESNVDMLEVDHKICWEQADHTLKFMEQGLKAVGF